MYFPFKWTICHVLKMMTHMIDFTLSYCKQNLYYHQAPIEVDLLWET